MAEAAVIHASMSVHVYVPSVRSRFAHDTAAQRFDAVGFPTSKHGRTRFPNPDGVGDNPIVPPVEGVGKFCAYIPQ
jgi:hypothetical protein